MAGKLPPLASESISAHDAVALSAAPWQLLGAGAGTHAHPAELADAAGWQSATVPGTVASALHADLDAPDAFDARDWWYRTDFDAAAVPGARRRLRFEGLATLAEIWLNGEPILTTDNMFRSWVVDVTGHLQAQNELVICFRALAPHLDRKRPRPRWKTALTSHQNLRWVRTTLLGHIPSWCPPVNPVGPWRPITLETVRTVDVTALDLQTALHGTTGTVRLNASTSGATVNTAALVVGSQRLPVTVTDGRELAVVAELPDIPVWWPHTHGTPALLPCRLELSTAEGAVSIDCGRVGFRTIDVDRADGRVRFLVNGVDVFCRGACWTCDDIRALDSEPEALRRTLQRARDAHLNMLRIGGTMLYESDAFYALCDELGILVWQDFMFANMDYPVSDADFLANIDAEVTGQLQRLQRHPSIAAYCAGSEIEQQAAMLGLPAGEWSNPFFAETLPQHCARWHAGVPYFRGSPSEGALPFHLGTGISHYYGVGAYRRPLSDARHAGVKFTTECLGFANVPDTETLMLLGDGAVPPPHHPRWKARVPRDNGTSWDFDDVRDFYLRELFGVDPVQLRWDDIERYHALSRLTSGEVMLRTFAEWRRADNPCGGALVWFFKDLWPGAGWGIVDSENRPKAACHYLRRAWAPRTVLITDDGLDGLTLHIHNDAPEPLAATLQLIFLQRGRIRTVEREQRVSVASHAVVMLSAEQLVGHFSDSSYAYRFGPPGHDTVVARLIGDDGTAIAEDVFFPAGMNLPMQDTGDVVAECGMAADGTVVITLRSAVFLQNVVLSATGFDPDDNHFHVAPGRDYRITCSPRQAGVRKFKAYLDALNLRETLTLRAETRE